MPPTTRSAKTKKIESKDEEKDTKKRSIKQGKKASAKKTKIDKEEESNKGKETRKDNNRGDEYLTDSIADATKRASEFAKHIKYVHKVQGKDDAEAYGSFSEAAPALDHLVKMKYTERSITSQHVEVLRGLVDKLQGMYPEEVHGEGLTTSEVSQKVAKVCGFKFPPELQVLYTISNGFYFGNAHDPEENQTTTYTLDEALKVWTDYDWYKKSGTFPLASLRTDNELIVYDMVEGKVVETYGGEDNWYAFSSRMVLYPSLVSWLQCCVDKQARYIEAMDDGGAEEGMKRGYRDELRMANKAADDDPFFIRLAAGWGIPATS